MHILAYNRVVRDLNGLTVEALLARLRESFDVQPSPAPVAPARRETFGLFVAGRWYRLEIRATLVPRADPVASLDVSLLQERALAPILGIGDPRTDKRIDFVGGIRGLSELEQRVANRPGRSSVRATPDAHGAAHGGRRREPRDAAEVDVVRAEARGWIAVARARLARARRGAR